MPKLALSASIGINREQGMDREQHPPAQPSGSSRSGLMARLTLSAVERLSEDPSCWREPVVHRALLISGLSVLLSSLAILEAHSTQQL
ncbi:hypothetical protein [Vulcanococcus sp.]|uniref:hypothetical protein n=1 Tax=Vulcanococcus sp. TaxID=2856995 RepID=UPI003C04F5E9